MHTYRARIKENGDVTLPEDARRRLGEDMVDVVVRDDGVVEWRRLGLTLDEVFGSIPAIKGGSVDFDAEIESAIEDHLAEKWGRLPQGINCHAHDWFRPFPER
jgi:bifunctional DNA-binding transcriptional regulator/antitoxin component of YhaV-PrlF toxin-antitoxin module